MLIHDQEGTQPVKVVGRMLPRKIVSQVGNVGAFTDIWDVGRTVGSDGKLRKHALVSFFGHILVALIHITPAYRHGDDVDIHAGTRCLQPVAVYGAFVHDLVPQTGLAVLVFRQPFNKVLQCGNQLRPIPMILRQHFEHVNDRHSIPAHGPAPEFGRVVGFVISPSRGPALIISMIEKTGGRVFQMFSVNQQLLDGLVVGVLALSNHLAVAHQERQGHIGPIQP